MAQLMEESNEEKTIFPKEDMDKDLLLSSFKSYAKDGVVLGVEKFLTPKRRDYGSGPKANINMILSVIGSMPKGRMYDLDDDGQYIMYEDEMTGETRRKIKIGDCQLKTVFFPFYANIKEDEEGLDDNTTLIITPGTSSYSFFKEALIDMGELPADMGKKAFSTSVGELKEAVEGWEFLGKYELIKGKNRSFPSLKCERLDKDEEE